MRPLFERGARLVAALLASAGMFACSAIVIDVEPATTGSGPTDADAGFANPGTLARPTVPGTGAPGLLAIEPLIAFMDAWPTQVSSGPATARLTASKAA